MTARIEGWARQMLERRGLFATLATVSPDGSPFQAVVWYLVRDDTIVVNSRVGRIWPTNLLRDPRCSLSIEAAYDWVSVRGRATPVMDQVTAQADIAEMARRYMGRDGEEAERIIRPERVSEHPDQ